VDFFSFTIKKRIKFIDTEKSNLKKGLRLALVWQQKVSKQQRLSSLIYSGKIYGSPFIMSRFS